MENKTAIGLVAAVIVIGILLFAFGSHVPKTVQIPLGTESAPTSSASTTPEPPVGTQPSVATPAPGSASAGAAAHTPAVTQSAPVATHKPRIVAFDNASLRTTSTHPVITGTANVSAVAFVLDDPSGVGIAGSDNVKVENGHWSFSIPQALKPGTYIVHLIGGDSTLDAKLIVE